MFLEVCDDLFAGLETIEPAIGLGRRFVDCRVFVKDVVFRQIVPLADFVIVEIMRGRDLDASGSEFRIHVFVCDDRHAALDEGQDDLFSDQFLIPFILRMYGNGAVAEHRFRACRRNHEMTVARCQRISQMPEMPRLLVVQHLEVGKNGVQDRIPVDEPIAAVDQPFVIKLNELFNNRRY